MAADIITKEQIKDYNKIPNKGPTVAKRRSGYLFEEAGICNHKEAWYNGGSKSDQINIGVSLLICFRKLVYAIIASTLLFTAPPFVVS